MNHNSTKFLFILICLISFALSSNSVAQEMAPVISKSFELKYDTACKVTRSYDVPECFITSSPLLIELIGFQFGEKIISYAVSPVGDCIGVIVEKGGSRSLQIFDTHSKKRLFEYILPTTEKIRNLCWHPKANALFVIGGSAEEFTVYRLTMWQKVWDMTPIYMSTHALTNLIVAPLPYVTNWDSESKTSSLASENKSL